MAITWYKTHIKGVKELFETKQLALYRNPTDRRKSLTKDFRSYQKEGMWYVHPIGFNEYSVYIVCPHCGEIHSHGKMPGHRISHCESKNNNGYVITFDAEEVKTDGE